jgi:hypothetical protein
VKNWTTFDWLLAAVVVWLLLQGSGAMQGCGASAKVTAVVMLYEADHGSLPPYAIGAANELSAAGAEVGMVDDDVLDGTGETPEWLIPALEPGRAIMGGTDGQDDALVLLAGERVIKAVKLPGTKEAILEACK